MSVLEREGRICANCGRKFIINIAALYGLSSFTEEGHQTNAIATAIDDYEMVWAPFRFDPYYNLRQILPRDFHRTAWWQASHREGQMTTAEDVYVLIFKLLFIPGENYNASVQCRITVDGIEYQPVIIITYPHPKNPAFYLGDSFSQFGCIILRPKKSFQINFGDNDFTAIPVGLALTRRRYTESNSITLPVPNVKYKATFDAAFGVKDEGTEEPIIDARIRGLFED